MVMVTGVAYPGHTTLPTSYKKCSFQLISTQYSSGTGAIPAKNLGDTPALIM